MEKLTTQAPLVSIEDPFDQDDFESYAKFTAKCGKAI